MLLVANNLVLIDSDRLPFLYVIVNSSMFHSPYPLISFSAMTLFLKNYLAVMIPEIIA